MIHRILEAAEQAQNHVHVDLMLKCSILFISMSKHRDSTDDWRGKPSEAEAKKYIFFKLQTIEYF